MFRTIAYLVGLASFATLLAEGIAVGVLVFRGQLGSDSLSRISAAISSQAEATTETRVEPEDTVMPSNAEVAAARTIQTLGLNARADDLLLLKQILDDQAAQLQKERAVYEQTLAAFRSELDELRMRSIDESTEQSRLIVKAMPPGDAVVYLLSLSETDGLRIVKGLPERTLAKILQEFASGTDEQQQRGHWLFEAISSARPESDIADTADRALSQQEAADSGG